MKEIMEIVNPIQKYIDDVVADMSNLGTYKSEFDNVIYVFATMLYQYDYHFELFTKEKFALEFFNDEGKSRPNPRVKLLDNLRKDIKTYSDSLQLNAKNIEPMAEKPTNKLQKLKAIQGKQGKKKSS